jgi:UDPglucose--hexose-1-phosphate uridylyltransferase
MTELRRDPLSGDWVLVFPQEGGARPDESAATCIYCLGREAQTGKEIYRRGGQDAGPSAWDLRVVAGSPPLFHVEGDFGKKAAGMCDRMEAIGAHEILIETPAHDVEFEDLDPGQIFAILDTIRVRARDLGNDVRLKHVMPFKVRTFNPAHGRPHPRWQILAVPFVPGVIKRELNAALEYFSFKERCVFCDYLIQERRAKARVIYEEGGMVALSPYAARVPFEVWVMPTKHASDFGTISEDETWNLARLLKRLTGSIKKLPESSGYVLTVHTAPFRRPKAGAWKTIDLDYHWHVQLDPCISVGDGLLESGGFHLNPVAPEEAASILSKLG